MLQEPSPCFADTAFFRYTQAVRVFIGVPLPKKLQESIKHWQLTYQQTFSPNGLRWMKEDNLHITILPPWDENDTETIIQILDTSIFPAEDFVVDLQKIIFMPKGKAKYVWVTGETPQALLDLRKGIAVSLGRPIEKRPFRLHTTIARFNKDALVTPIEEDLHWTFHIHSFALLQSQLLTTGAEYKILKTFPFV